MIFASVVWTATFPAAQSDPAARKTRAETVKGYAEYRNGDVLVIEGQRVRPHPGKIKYRGVKSLEAIPLGFEAEAKGVRLPDGVILATEISAKPNGIAMYEGDVLNATNQIEQTWVQNKVMFEPIGDGKAKKIGDIKESGPEVDRVRGIMNRLRPPYVPAEALRVRVVVTEEWNASAMGNGAIWVYTGLMDAVSDDELAIVLGHELAHYTHEHTRKQAKQGMFTQLLGAGAAIGGSYAGTGMAGQMSALGASLGLTAFSSGYSRDAEDQADRVGLRYAYEGGFDVRKGPVLWGKFRDKYGEQDSVTNFFVGSHSRPSDRIRNIQQELALNYSAPQSGAR
jgi:Zn-dependent protease with chaperone function